MNVYKIYGNYTRRVFFVVANDHEDAFNLLFKKLLSEGYSEEEVDEMELSSYDDFCIDASSENVMELNY